MRPLGDSPLVRTDETLASARDHGLAHGFEQFSGAERRLDPREMVGTLYDAVAALAARKALAETCSPSHEDGVR